MAATKSSLPAVFLTTIKVKFSLLPSETSECASASFFLQLSQSSVAQTPTTPSAIDHKCADMEQLQLLTMAQDQLMNLCKPWRF